MATLQASQSKIQLWTSWVVINTLGAVIGWMIAVALGFITLGALLIVAGGMVGIVMGVTQTLFFERFFPQCRWSNWLYVTTIGATLCWIVFPATQWLFALQDRTRLYHPVSLIGSFAIGGAIFGVAQWVVFRKNRQDAALWIFANCVSWSVAVPIGSIIGDGVVRFFYQELDPYAGRLIGLPSYILLFVVGVVSTVIYSAIIGITLLRLWPKATS